MEMSPEKLLALGEEVRKISIQFGADHLNITPAEFERRAKSHDLEVLAVFEFFVRHGINHVNKSLPDGVVFSMQIKI